MFNDRIFKNQATSSYDNNQQLNKISFSKYISEKRQFFKREKDSPKKGESLTISELSARLAPSGPSVDMLKKILYRQKMQTRDCIIAICGALNLTVEETNEALFHYDYLPRLDNREGTRDKVIINALQTQSLNSFITINTFLENNNFKPLQLKVRKNKKEKREKLKYEILRKGIRKDLQNLIYGDPYDSIETLYSPDKSDCTAEMIIKEKGTFENIYRLVYSSKGTSYVENYNKPIQRRFEEDEKMFSDYFLELRTICKQEKNRLLEIFNDTKNYGSRMGAIMKEGYLHLINEKYNFNIPENDEYLMVEYYKGQYLFSISQKSRFYRYYLQGEFDEHYSKNIVNQDVQAKDFESIEKNELTGIYNYEFSRMKKELTDYMDDIKNKKLYIRNAEHIYDGPDIYDICKYFNLEKDFGYTTKTVLIEEDMNCGPLDEKYGKKSKVKQKEKIEFREQYLEKNEVVFEFDNQKVIINFEELKRAFELGYDNKEQILINKLQLGSIENIF